MAGTRTSRKWTNPRVLDDGIHLSRSAHRIAWKRLAFVFTGLILFAVVCGSPRWPDAVDPAGKHFALTWEGKAGLGLFLLAVLWWITDVVPIGITAVAVGVVQVLFLIRPARVALTDFMDSAVWFILASIVIGMVFTRTGLAKRMAYRMLVVVGERTSMIYLGCFVTTAALTHVMAYTAVAAVAFPLFMSIHALYEENPGATRFGKGLFIGTAFAAAAGSIVTLLGAARSPVAISFFKSMVGHDITFLELTKYMFPLGWVMVFVVWALMMVLFHPEKKRIPGLRERARALHARLGPMSKTEILALGIVLLTVAALCAQSFVPALEPLDKSGIILVSTFLFFLFKILTVKDLEDLPWNLILLLGGATSIGFCLWQTGAAAWLAINWLTLFQDAHWFFLLGTIAFVILMMTNLIVNVAVVAITLPVALVLAPYLGVAPELILFCALSAAGMPCLLLAGAASNAIAYESKQFTPWEFFRAGVPTSIAFMLVLAAFVAFIWPAMNMPVLTP